MAEKNELMALDPEMQALMAGSSVDPKEQRANIDDEDKKEPRISLMQGLSEFVSSGEAQIGAIVHSADAFTFAPPGETLAIVPIMYWKSRTLFEEVADGVGQVLCDAPDGQFGTGTPGGECAECPNSEWTDAVDSKGQEKRTPPACRAAHNFLVYVPSADEVHSLAVLSFAKTSYGTGTKLINRLMGLPGQFWMHSFNIFSRQSGEGKTKWWIYDLKAHSTGKFDMPINQLLPEKYQAVFKSCEALYLQFKEHYGKRKSSTKVNLPKAAVATPEVPVSGDEVPF